MDYKVNNWKVAKSVVIRVHTPVGEMFVTLIEDPATDNLIEIRLNIGKAGTGLMAWADALALSISTSLQAGIDVYKILENLLGISSDKLVYSSGIPIKSGPDGIATAILMYLKDKNQQSGKDQPYFKRIPPERDWE